MFAVTFYYSIYRIRSIQSQFSGLITPDKTESTEVLKLLFRLTLNYLELLVSLLVLFPIFGPFRNALPSRLPYRGAGPDNCMRGVDLAFVRGMGLKKVKFSSTLY